MKRLEELKDDCDFYLAEYEYVQVNSEVDRLCEYLAQDILSELASYVERRLPASSYVNALKIYLGLK